MIPASVQRDHILQALRAIDRDGVPRGRQARGYELIHEGRGYPPKYVVALAAEFATGATLKSDAFGGGKETNGFLGRLGFEVSAKGSASSSLRVALVTLRLGTTEPKALEEAFVAARAGYEGRLLVLFPGASEHWSEDLDRFVALARKHRASCIAELRFSEGHRYTVYRAGANTVDDLRIEQVFGGGAEADRHPEFVERVLVQCEPGGARRVDIEGVQVGVIVCGENNLLQNRQSKGNICEGVRNHPGRELLPGVDIVLNGAHTIMGNWDKLNHRFSWLSRGPRLLAYSTNNTNKHAWSTALRVHYGEKRVATGDGIDPNWAGSPSFNVDFVRRDHFRIVLMDGVTPLSAQPRQEGH